MKPEWRKIISDLTEKGIEERVVLKVLKDTKKHSDFSASGSERWLNCPGSVQLSRKVPKQPDTFYTVEGTIGHYYLEVWLLNFIKTGRFNQVPKSLTKCSDMYRAVKRAMEVIAENWDRDSEEIQLEQKVSLAFIHPTMFGTSDVIIYDPVFGRLKVYDYKHGQGHIVDTEETGKSGMKSYNTQLMYYALGAAYKIGIKKISEVEIGIIQPRGGGDGFKKSEFKADVLQTYKKFFENGVKRALSPNPRFYAGKWCHWCPAKEQCPAQDQIEVEKVSAYFD